MKADSISSDFVQAILVVFYLEVKIKHAITSLSRHLIDHFQRDLKGNYISILSEI